MEKTTNTSKTPMLEWLFGGNPEAIEAQEAQGQNEFTESLQLPKRCDDIKNVVHQYNLMGIKVLTPSKGDDLFFGTILPYGWRKKPTDRSMWSDLVDDKGRTRAVIFYKAAFYDRDSFISFNTRFTFSCEIKEHINEADHYKKRNNESRFGQVKDCEIVVFKTQEEKFSKKYKEDKHREWWNEYEQFQVRLRAQAQNWLIKDYPNYKDINAYW